ncbi:TPA: hypothetical protein ACW5C9_000154 [Salmonella enterica subsp. enterica serovar Nagoya]
MNILKYTTSILLLLIPSVCFSAGGLTSHQVLVDCNRASSSLVSSYEKDVPLQESKRMDLIQKISLTCQGAYQNAYDGMQYEDIEREVLSSLKNSNGKLNGESKNNSEKGVGLVISAIQSGFYIYQNGGLQNKK